VPRPENARERLDAVLAVIHLLFNEGYCASGGEFFIRYELCEEAIRIAAIISSHPAITQKEDVHALLSLMLLNASRFKSRDNSNTKGIAK